VFGVEWRLKELRFKETNKFPGSCQDHGRCPGSLRLGRHFGRLTPAPAPRLRDAIGPQRLGDMASPSSTDEIGGTAFFERGDSLEQVVANQGPLLEFKGELNHLGGPA
jgi:hypothetical protein